MSAQQRQALAAAIRRAVEAGVAAGGRVVVRVVRVRRA